MYHYLRTEDRKKLVVIEPWIWEGYYKFSVGIRNLEDLLNIYDTIPAERKAEFKSDFDEIGRMRDWFFDTFFPKDLGRVVSEKNLDRIHEAIRLRLMNVGEKYGLIYGQD